jgi:hypothetical protein
MKTMMVTLMVMVMAGWSQLSLAQSPTDKLFEKYNGKDGFTTVHITQELFSLFADLDESDPDVAEMKTMMEQLQYIRILMYDLEDGGRQSELEAFRTDIKASNLTGYSELMNVKEKDQEVKFMAMKNDGKITELLLLINEPNEAGFISIVGNIDINTVSKLSKTMHMEGMDELEKLDQEK